WQEMAGITGHWTGHTGEIGHGRLAQTPLRKSAWRAAGHADRALPEPQNRTETGRKQDSNSSWPTPPPPAGAADPRATGPCGKGELAGPNNRATRRILFSQVIVID